MIFMLGLFKKKKTKIKESRFYLLACQILREDGYKPVRLSYIFNIEKGEFEKKEFADINMLYSEHIRSTKEELLTAAQTIISCNVRSNKSKTMKNFFSNAVSIGIVEEYISENDESFSIKSRFYPIKYSGPHIKKGQVVKDAELIIIEKGN